MGQEFDPAPTALLYFAFWSRGNTELKVGETWRTLLADSEKRIEAFETKCLRKLLCISYMEHKIKDWVQSKINSLVGPQDRNLFWQLSRDRN